MDGWTRVIGRGAATLAWARERAAALAAANAPGVVVPHRVVMSRAGEVVVTTARVHGVTLADALATGPGLQASHVRSIGVMLARALAGLHGAGLVHGDLSTSTVMLSEGSAVVVDVMTPPNTLGTPGFTEPGRQEPVHSTDDVYALGQVLLAITAAEQRDQVEPWVAPMLTERGQRPGAQQVAQAWERWGPVEPVHVESAPVEPAHADAVPSRPVHDETVHSEAVPREAVHGQAVAERTELGPRTLRLAQGRPWRVYRAAWRAFRAALGLATALVVVSVVTGLVSVEPAPEVRPYHPVLPIPAFADRGPEYAAIDLTQRRVKAMASGNADALARLTVEGSVAHAASAGDLDLVATGVRWEGAAVVEVQAAVLSQRDRRASVTVQYVVSAHVVVQDDDRTEVPQTQARAQLDLLWTEQGWQVERVIPVA